MNDIVSFLQKTVLRPLGYLVVKDYEKPWGITPYAKLGEDAILSALLARLPEVPPFYVDIGAENGVRGSNTALLAARGWRGVAVDYDKEAFRTLALQYEKKPGVALVNAKVTPANVLALLSGLEVPARPGVLSLDIDTCDLYVLEKILSRHQPAIVIAEINEKIPPPTFFAVKYCPGQSWDGSHFFGASLSAFAELTRGRYAIHALEYNNVFLVRRDLAKRVKTMDAATAYEEGFRSKADRLEKFPWNADAEDLIGCRDPKALRALLQKRFAKYRGRYVLR